jgi:FK506-binding nuclear protein
VGTGSEESSEFDSENGYDDHFFDDSDMEMYTSSPVRSSGGILFVSSCFLEAIKCSYI